MLTKIEGVVIINDGTINLEISSVNYMYRLSGDIQICTKIYQ